MPFRAVSSGFRRFTAGLPIPLVGENRFTVGKVNPDRDPPGGRPAANIIDTAGTWMLDNDGDGSHRTGRHGRAGDGTAACARDASDRSIPTHTVGKSDRTLCRHTEPSRSASPAGSTIGKQTHPRYNRGRSITLAAAGAMVAPPHRRPVRELLDRDLLEF